MTRIIRFSEPDPERPEKEAFLADLDDATLAATLQETRKAAAMARANQAMDDLFQLVRGMKTIHRIANQRGLILKRPISASGP